MTSAEYKKKLLAAGNYTTLSKNETLNYLNNRKEQYKNSPELQAQVRTPDPIEIRNRMQQSRRNPNSNYAAYNVALGNYISGNNRNTTSFTGGLTGSEYNEKLRDLAYQEQKRRQQELKNLVASDAKYGVGMSYQALDNPLQNTLAAIDQRNEYKNDLARLNNTARRVDKGYLTDTDITGSVSNRQNRMDEIASAVNDLQNKLAPGKNGPLMKDTAEYQAAQRNYFNHDNYLNRSDYAENLALGKQIQNPNWAKYKQMGDSVIENKATFARDNKQNVRQTRDKDLFKYTYMTKDEVDIYTYILQTQGKEQAEAYVNSIADDLNYREGSKAVNAMQNLPGIVKPAAYTSLATTAGAESFANGIAQNFTNDRRDLTALEYANMITQQNLADDDSFGGKAKSVLYNSAYTVGNMAPSIAASMLTGSAGVGTFLMGASAAGNAYAQAIDEGYDETGARIYSGFIGAFEGGLQYALGGLSKLAGKNGVSGKLFERAAKLDSAAKKVAARLAISESGEIIEEELQNFLAPMMESILFDEKYDAPDGEELLETLLVTAISTLFMESGTTVYDTHATEKYLRNEYADEVTQPKIIEAVSNELKAKGITDTDVRNAVVNKVSGKELDEVDQQILAENEVANEVANTIDLSSVQDAKSATNEAMIAHLDKAATVSPDNTEVAKLKADIQSGKSVSAEHAYTVASGAITESNKQNLRTAVVERLNALGETENTGAVADAVVSKVTGENVTAKQERYFEDSKYGERVVNELQSRNGVSNAWVNNVKEEYDGIGVGKGTKNAARALNMDTDAVIDAYNENNAKLTSNGKRAVSLNTFAREAELAMNYGRSDIELTDELKDNLGSLAPSTLSDFYKAGNIEYKKAVNTPAPTKTVANRRGGVNAKYVMTDSKGNVLYNKNGTVRAYDISMKRITSKFNGTQRNAFRVITAIARATGINVNFYESREDAKGNFVGANGMFTRTEDAIYIDVNSGLFKSADRGSVSQYVMLRTFGHELTHYIEKWSPAQYEELSKVVFSRLTEQGHDITKLIDYERSKDSRLTEEGARREVVAEAMTDMIRDSKFINEVVTEHQTLADKIIEFLRDFANNIRSYFNSLDTNSKTAANALQLEDENGDLRYFDDIVDAWDAALRGAIANYQSAQLADSVEEIATGIGEVNPDGTPSVPNSYRSLAEAAGFEAYEDENTGVRWWERDGKTVTEITEDDIRNSPIGALIMASIKNNDFKKGITKSEADKQIKYFARICSLAAKTNDFSMAMQFAGSALFTAMKSNSDTQYGTTYDFPSICTKTQAMIDAMSAAMIKIKRGLETEEIENLYRTVFNMGNSVPCPECYVFSRWIGIGGLLNNVNRYQERYKNMSVEDVRSAYYDMYARIEKHMSDMNIPKEKFGRGKGSLASKIRKEYNKLKEDIEKKDNQGEPVKDSDRLFLENLSKELDAVDAMTWIENVYFNGNLNSKKMNPKAIVPVNILFDLNAGNKFAMEYPEAWAFRCTQGAGYGKAITPYAESVIGEGIMVTASQKFIKDKQKYAQDPKHIGARISNPFLQSSNGELNKDATKKLTAARKKAQIQNFLGGQRYSSTSDALYENFSDFLLAALETQAVGGMVQVYTKVAGAVESYNAWGWSSNQSLMPKFGGLDENGVPLDTPVGGMNPQTAISNREKFEQAGTITIGVNDKHIIAMMGQRFRDFIIPYHASGGKAEVVAFMRAVQEGINARLNRNLPAVRSSDYTRVQGERVMSAEALRKIGKTDAEIELIEKRRAARLAILTGTGPKDMSVINGSRFLRELNRRFTDGEWAGVRVAKGKINGHIFPNEYWDTDVTYENSKKISEDYLAYCDELGYLHKFSGKVINSNSDLVPVNGYDENGNKVPLTDLAYDENGNVRDFYWKLLVDRRMYGNDGRYLPQKVSNLTATPEKAHETFSKSIDGSREYNKTISEETVRDINNGTIQFSHRVDDKALLAQLNAAERKGFDDPNGVVKVYRGMQIQPVDANGKVINGVIVRVKDYDNMIVEYHPIVKGEVSSEVKSAKGQLYSPMAGKVKVNGKYEWSSPININAWEETDVDYNNVVPEYDEDGNIKKDKNGIEIYNYILKKGGKNAKGGSQTDVPARFNPYIHTSLQMLNDQFSSANVRPELVTVECLVPKSELTSGFRFDKAKDSVGAMSWHSGPVSSRLSHAGKPRVVILTRYDKPIRIVPDEEVARSIKNLLGDTGIPLEEASVPSRIARLAEDLGIRVLGKEEWNDYKKSYPPEYYDSYAENAKKNTAHDVQYSIRYTTDNSPVVVVNDNIIKYAYSRKEIEDVVRSAISKFNKIPIKGQTIHFIRDTKNEYVRSAYSSYIFKNESEKYTDKMRLSAHPHDIIYATTNYINEGLKHPRKDLIADFARGNILIDVDGRKYSAEVVIGFTKSGICELHDVVNLTPTTFEYKKAATPRTTTAKAENQTGVTADDTLPQDDNTVNTQNSLRDVININDSDRIGSASEGTIINQILNGTKTVETRNAGTNNRTLKKWQSMVGKRIAIVRTGTGDGMRPYIVGYVTVEDIVDYPDRDSWWNDRKRHRVVNDKSAFYWKEGEEGHKFGIVFSNPKRLTAEEQHRINKDVQRNTTYQVEEDAKFAQYSKRDSDGNNLSSAQVEFFKNSKIRDEDGNLRVVYHGSDAEFTVFDRTKTRANMDIQGNFFSPWEIDAGGYGSNVKAYYLNITNPAPESVGYAALNRFKGQNEAGVKAREYLESLGYDGVNNGDEEYISFYPEQIKLIDNKNPTDNVDVQLQLRDRAVTDRDLLAMVARGDVSVDVPSSIQKGLDAYLRRYDEYNELVKERTKLIRNAASIKEIAALDHKIEVVRRQMDNSVGLKSVRSTLIKARTKVENEKIRTSVKEYRESREDRLERTNVRKDLLKLSNELGKMVTNRTKKVHAPEYYIKYVASVCESVSNNLIERKLGMIENLRDRADRSDYIVAQELEDRADKMENALDKMRELNNAYKNFKDSSLYEEYYDENLEAMADGMADILKSKSIYDMTAPELRYIRDTLKAFVHNIKNANKTISMIDEMTIRDVATNLGRDMDQVASKQGKFSEFAEQVGMWQMRPDTFFKYITGYKKNGYGEKIQQMFVDGTERMLTVQRDFYNMFSKLTESEDKKFNDAIKRMMNKPTKDMCSFGMRYLNGEEVQVPRGMMLQIYKLLLQEDSFESIAESGLKIPRFDKYYNGNTAAAYGKAEEDTIYTQAVGEEYARIMEENKELRENLKALRNQRKESTEDKIAEIDRQIDEIDETIKANMARSTDLLAMSKQNLEEIRSNIESQLTDTDKAILALANNWYAYTGELMADVFESMYGYRPILNDNYTAIHRDPSTAFNTDLTAVSEDFKLENSGFTKERTGSRGTILLTDIFNELKSQSDRFSRYYGFAQVQHDFNRIWNLKALRKMDGSKTTLKDKIEQKYGAGGGKLTMPSGTTYIDNYVKEVTGNSVEGRSAKGSITAGLYGMSASATLPLNLRVAFSQLASVPTAAAVVGWKNMAIGFTKGLPTALSKEKRNQLAQDSVWFWQRYRGAGGMTELADLRQSKGWGRIANSRFGKKLFNWCQAMDVFATSTMWEMAKSELRSRGITEPSDKQIADMYRDIIRKTQPNYTESERSDLLRNKSTSMKFITMYKTQSNQNLNILMEATGTYRRYARDYKKGINDVTKRDLEMARRDLANAYTSVIIGGTVAFVGLRAMINMLLGTLNGYRDDDKDLTTESVIAGLVKEIGSTLAGMVAFGGIVYDFVYAIISHDKFYGISDTALGVISDALTQTSYFSASDKSIDDWSKLITKWLVVGGVPIANAKKFVDAYKMWATDIQNGQFGSFEGTVDRTKSQKYHRLVMAYVNNDYDKQAMIIGTLGEDDDFTSDVKTAAKKAYNNGELSFEQYSGVLKDVAGLDADDASDVVAVTEFDRKYPEYKNVFGSTGKEKPTFMLNEMDPEYFHGIWKSVKDAKGDNRQETIRRILKSSSLSKEQQLILWRTEYKKAEY